MSPACQSTMNIEQQSQPPVLFTNTTSTTTSSTSIAAIERHSNAREIISHNDWIQRIQDNGVREKNLRKKSCRQSKIPAIGPNEDQLFYPDLSAIAIDLSKHFCEMQSLGKGWLKVPKNRTDVKTKIISRLLALRKQSANQKHALDQLHFLNTLEGMWGEGAESTAIHHNDRARIFGIAMSLQEHCLIFERLALGVTHRSDLDDVSMSMEQIF